MAVISNSSSNVQFNPGFTFSDFQANFAPVMNEAKAMVNDMVASGNGFSLSGPSTDKASFWAVTVAGTKIEALGPYTSNGLDFNLDEYTLSRGDAIFEVQGKGMGILGLDQGKFLPTLKADSLYIGDDSANGVGIYFDNASLTVDTSKLGLSGSAKEAYLVVRNGDAGPGDAYYVKLTGNITVTSDALIAGGQITKIEYGTFTENESGDPTFDVAGSFAGVKIDVAQLMSTLETTGFDGVTSLLYKANDTITGTSGDDVLLGFEGNDKISGGDGDDLLVGGAGNDTIDGGAGNDLIHGDGQQVKDSGPAPVGNDKITDQSGDNTVYAGDGNDQVTLGAGNDTVYSGSGNDKIALGDGAATATLTVDDLDFSDRLFHNLALLGEGKKAVTAGSGDDYISVGNGANSVTAGHGDNVVIAGNGNNKITTGDGADDIAVGDGNNNINAGKGDNQIEAGNGNNKVTTGEGNDHLFLGNGNNTVTLGNGSNVVEAGNGNNKITGAADDDSVTTGTGNNTLKLGLGSDVAHLTGGKTTLDLGKDAVTDTVEFDADFFAALESGQLFSANISNFGAGDEIAFDLVSMGITAADIAVGSAADIQGAVIGLDTSTGKLYYDADGAGNEFDAMQFGLVKGLGLKETASVGDDGTIHFGA